MKKILLIFSVVCLLPLISLAQGSKSAPESWVSSYQQTYNLFVDAAQSPTCRPWDVTSGMASLIISHTSEYYDVCSLDGVEIPDSSWVGVFYSDDETDPYCCGYTQYIRNATTHCYMLAPVCNDNVYSVNGYWVPTSGGGHSSDEIIAMHIRFYINGHEYEVSQADQYASPLLPFPPTTLNGKYERAKYYSYHILNALSVAPSTVDISGNITCSGNPLAGVSVAFENASAVVTDADGNYTITVDSPYSGTATPSLNNYSFAPANIVYTDVNDNLTDQNYVATHEFVNVSGSVTDAFGLAVSNVTVTVEGYPSVTTNVSGYYSISVAYGYSGTITPSKTDYTFNPASFSLNNLSADVSNMNFVATPVTHENVVIAGYILDGDNNPLKGISVSSTNNAAVTTDANGFYSISVAYNYSGVVTPSDGNYEFTPVSRNYSNIIANVVNQNFIASELGAKYTLTGVAFIDDGTKNLVPAAGAVVFCGNMAYTVGSNGEYHFNVREGWSGIIRVYLSNYSFTPVAISPVYGDATANIYGHESTSPWTYVNTPIMHIIYGGFPVASIPFTATIAGITILPGDWIGVFDGNTCLGAAQWNGGVGDFYITAYGNVDGSTSGNTLTYKISSSLSGSYVDYTVPAVNVTYEAIGGVVPSVPFPNSDDGLFMANGTSILLAMNAEADVANISGKVTFNTASGNPISNVTLLIGNFSVVKTDVDGNYATVVLSDWSGVVTPYLRGYYFTPASRTYNNITTDQTNQDYVAAYKLNIVSGTITDEGGNPLNNIAVRVYEGSNLLTTVYTNNAGYYHYDSVDFLFKGRLLPQNNGYYFAPYSYKIKNTYNDVSNIDFVEKAKVMPADWQADLSNHGALMQNLVGYYTYPYDSETHRFIPQLNGMKINDGDWIGAFYWDNVENKYKCAGAEEFFSEEPGFYMTIFGADAYGEGFANGQEIKFAVYSEACQKTVYADVDASFYSADETVITDAVNTGIYWGNLTFKANMVSELKSIVAEDNTLTLDIYGYVKDNNGNALPNVNIFGKNHSILATTDNTGYYIVNDAIVYGGSNAVTVIPALASYVFDPISYTTVPPVSVNVRQDFVGTYHDAPWIINPEHGFEAHTVIIPDTANITLNGADLNYGNYIGIFYNDENNVAQCGGYLCWTGVNSTIVVYSDETSLTPNTKDGFSDGEAFQWKMYSFEDDSTRVADADYIIGYNMGGMITIGGNFHANGLSLVSSVYANDSIESNITSTLPAGKYCGDSNLPVTLTMNPVNYNFNDITYHWIINVNGTISTAEGKTYTIAVVPAYNVPCTYTGYVQKGDKTYMCANSVTYTFDQPVVVSNITVDNPTVCSGSTVNLSATIEGGNGTYTYLWTADDPACVINNPTSLNASAAISQHTVFTLTVNSGTCEITATVAADIFAPVTAGNIEHGALVYCSGVNADTLRIVNVNGGSGNYNYTWMYKEANEAVWHDANVNDVKFVPQAPVTSDDIVYMYTAVVNDADCNTFYATDTLAIEWYQLMSVTLNVNNVVVCNGSDITLTAYAQGGTNQYNYTFMQGANVLYQGGNNTYVYQIPADFVGIVTFSVIVNDVIMADCSTATANVDVTVKGTIGDLVICNTDGDTVNNVEWCGAQYQLVATIANQFSEQFCKYQWQRRGASENEWYSIFNAKRKNYTAAQSSEPVSYYRVLVSIDGCPDQKDTANVIIVWANSERVVTIGDEQIVCEGTAFEPLTSTVVGGQSSYQWFLNGNPIIDGNNATYLPTEGGVYSLMVYNLCGRSFMSNSVTLTLVPAPVVYAGDDAEFCFTHSYKITTSYMQNCSYYYWDVVEGNGGIDDHYAVNPTYYPSSDDQTVVLRLRAMGNDPCNTFVSDEVVLNVIAAPDITAVIDGDDENGMSCDVDVNNFNITVGKDATAYTYEWSLLPINEAGTIAAADNSAVVMWTDGFTGKSQVVVKIYACNGLVYQFVKDVYRNVTPSTPESIQGATLVSVNSESTQYFVPAVAKANGYVWSIYPIEAGIISQNDNSMTIIWNGNWTGIVTINVAAINDCGTSVPNTLQIERTSEFIPEGITDNESSMSVYPNPNNGTFTLKTDNISGTYDVVIYNYTGQVIYNNSYSVAAPVITIPSAASGVYFVKMTYNGTSIVKRVVVR